MDENALLDLPAWSEIFNQMWVMANPDGFLANNEALVAYNNDNWYGHGKVSHIQVLPYYVQFPARVDSADDSENVYYIYEDYP